MNMLQRNKLRVPRNGGAYMKAAGTPLWDAGRSIRSGEPYRPGLKRMPKPISARWRAVSLE